MKSWFRKALAAIAIVVILVIAANFLVGWFAWRAYVGSLQPNVDFELSQVPPAPDYANRSAWLVTPQAPGLSILTPGPLRPISAAQAQADVFFVHPTTYFGRDNWNADIEDFAANKLLENMVVPTQLSVFNGCCRIYAPRYRQASFFSFLRAGPNGRQALEAAYGDVRRAFEHFIAVENNGRPFILASHSQGTVHAIRLLEEVITDAVYRERMIAAYLPGFSLPQDKRQTTLTWLPLCETKDSYRCLVAWDTFAKTGGPKHATDQGEHYYADTNGGHWERRGGKVATCVNPISWSAGLGDADEELHEGSTYVVLPGIGNASLQPILAPLALNDVSARCDEDGYLYISEPTSPVYRIGMLPEKWYHNHDYNLFYMNIRNNAVARVNAFNAGD